MDSQTQIEIAQRVVDGLGVQAGELISVRDDSGCFELLLEILLTIERLGATPLPNLTPANYMERLWNESPHTYLAQWDRHRQVWSRKIDRVLVLLGAYPDFEAVPDEAFQVWESAVQRLTIIEEERRLPVFLVATPTEGRATQLGLSQTAMEQILLPALLVSTKELQSEIDRVLNPMRSSQHITIQTGEEHTLLLERGSRAWLCDDGYIDETDRSQGAIVSNIPAGSIYTTVVESETRGSIRLPKAGPAKDVVLHFDGGRIVDIDAATGAAALSSWLDSHSGEPRRVGHIGIGLNPYLNQPIGWTFVDHCAQGFLWISLGENQYMGGQNESSLNVDFEIPRATMWADDRAVVIDGTVVV